MTDKMPREEIIRRLRLIANLKTGDAWPPEFNTGPNDWNWGGPLSELAAAAADLLEATEPERPYP
jgi:hypothetical protein